MKTVNCSPFYFPGYAVEGGRPSSYIELTLNQALKLLWILGRDSGYRLYKDGVYKEINWDVITPLPKGIK